MRTPPTATVPTRRIRDGRLLSGPASVSSAHPVSPAVEALQAFIRSSVESLEQVDGEGPERGEGLLFLGAWSDALPRMLIEDPVLAPTDKIVWQVIKLRARAQSATAFPSYQTIGRLANVRAQATVARAIAILRASRWLTLCARVRDARGRFRGNVYALHDEPLPLADTLYLDPEYMPFLENACEHQHGRVRSIAAAALSTIEDEIRRGTDVTDPHSSLERRVEAINTVHAQGQGGFFSFNRRRLEQLRGAPLRNTTGEMPSTPSSESEGGGMARRQHETLVPQTSGEPSSSPNSEDGPLLRSSRSNKTTTTPTYEQSSTERDASEELLFPERLSANHRALALIYVGQLPVEHRQAVLDELEGRLRAERRGAPAVYDPLRFLKKLCDTVASGEFVENLGVAVRAERDRARESEARIRRMTEAAVAEIPPPDPNNPLVKRVMRMRASRAARKQGQ